MDKHLKTLAPKHLDTKFIKLDAEVGILFILTAISALFEPFVVKVCPREELVGANYLKENCRMHPSLLLNLESKLCLALFSSGKHQFSLVH